MLQPEQVVFHAVAMWLDMNEIAIPNKINKTIMPRGVVEASKNISFVELKISSRRLFNLFRKA